MTGGVAVLLGAAMNQFGKLPARTVASMARSVAGEALTMAGLAAAKVETVFFANAVGGLLTGQEMIRGQAALRGLNVFNGPLFNVENACASGSSAFALAVAAVNSGSARVALAVGAEKLTSEDRGLVTAAIGSAVDLDESMAIADWAASVLCRDGLGDGPVPVRSMFMDLYGARGLLYAERSGATAEDFARVVVKSRHNAALNPYAQFRRPTTIEEVLDARVIVPGLTLPMCSPTGDGAAAVVVVAPEVADELGAENRAVSVLAAEVATGFADPAMTAERGSSVYRASNSAYERAGIGPEDFDVIELHDAAAPAELMAYEELRLCAAGDGPALLRSGATEIGGGCPVNVSGGLLSRGHPIGATGLAQIVEIYLQLTGGAGDRQVYPARFGLTENSGGWIGGDAATTVVTVLSAPDRGSPIVGHPR
jgi:acetyl-CoA acyltransferase